MSDEKKTLKFQMMMAPGEAEQLDDWMFRNRIRSRAEAIRQLWQAGLLVSARRHLNLKAAIAMIDETMQLLKDLTGEPAHHKQAIALGRRAIESAAVNLGRQYGYEQVESSVYQNGEAPTAELQRVIETAAHVRDALISDYQRIVADYKRTD